VNVDAEKVMLWTKKEDDKKLEEYVHQYRFAGNYLDRREAIDFASKKLDNNSAVDLLKSALRDKYEGLRLFALSKVDLRKDAIKKDFETVLADLAKNDKAPLVRALAIQKLGEYKKAEYASLFKAATNDSSYTVAGNAITALAKVDPASASEVVKQLSDKPAKGVLQEVLMNEILKTGDESMADKVIGDFANMPLSQGKFQALNGLSTYLIAIKNPEKIKWGIDEIVKFRDAIPEAFKSQTDPFINGMVLKGILADKDKKAKESKEPALIELVNYIKSKMPEEDRKGF
jgi:aminopeptidase N